MILLMGTSDFFFIAQVRAASHSAHNTYLPREPSAGPHAAAARRRQPQHVGDRRGGMVHSLERKRRIYMCYEWIYSCVCDV